MIEEMVRTELKRAAGSIPAERAEELDRILLRGRRRRSVKRIGWGLASMIVAVGSLVMIGAFQPNVVGPATGGIETVEIADLAVPVRDSDPVLTDPDVWIGLPGPSPRFDTTQLGEDLSFQPGEPQSGDFNEENLVNDGWPGPARAVYLGELDGEPFYVYSAGAPSIWDRIFEIIDGNLSGDVLGTSLSCCSGGNMDHEGGLPGFSTSSSIGHPDVIVAEWLGLSPEVSVVAYEMDGVFVGWQTPVGGVSSIRLDKRPAEIRFFAYDSLGRQVDRFDPARLMAPPPDGSEQLADGPGADWAPLQSDGTEIEVGEIADGELRDQIEPLPTDRLFLVAMNGAEIIVRLRGNTPHVFTVSCDFLATVDLPPGWASTCLR